MHVRGLRKAAGCGQARHSVSKQVSALSLLPSRMEKQMARLLEGMYKLAILALALSLLDDSDPSADICSTHPA